MQKNRAIFDFGSTYFTIYQDGKVLLHKPTALIVKRSIRPAVVSIGEEAVKNENKVADDELFLRPVKKGTVAHKVGCSVLIREYVSEVFGKITKPAFCVLIGCGLNPEQKNEIEKAFIEAGITDVFLMESLLGLVPFLKKTDIKIAAIVGGETTEIGLFEAGKLITGYSMDIGSGTVNERIIAEVKENDKLIISEESAEILKKQVASLYQSDLSKCAVTGADAITGRGKRLVLTAKELHPCAVYVYGRILKVIDSVLLTSPVDTLRTVEKTGVLFTGLGSLQEGLRDYATKTLKIPVTVMPDEKALLLSGAYTLANDAVFVEEYLSLIKDN